MFARAVAKYLSAISSGPLASYVYTESGASTIGVGNTPDTPDAVIGVMPDGGRAQLTKVPYDLPSVQVIVRGSDPAAAHDVAVAVMEALSCLDGVTLDDGGADEVYLVGMTAAQSHPIPMGFDDARRPEFSVNFDATITAPTTNRSA